MRNKNKTIIGYIVGAVLGIILILFLVKYLGDNKYRGRIPEMQNTSSLTEPVDEQIEDAFAQARRNPSAENLGTLGMVYHSSANYPEAAKSYELAIARNKSGWKWNYYNGYLAIEMGKPEIAVGNFEQVVDETPGAGLAWYYLGQQYKNLGNSEQAVRALNKIIADKTSGSVSKSTTRNDHFPLRTYAMFEMARIYYDAGNLEQAEETLTKLIQKDNLFGPAYRLLGNIYSMQGKASEGEKFTIRASDLLGFSPPVDTLLDKLVLMSRSELYLLKKIDEAERNIHSDWAARLVEHSLKYLPDNDYLISKAIRIYLWKGQNEKALALTDKHMKMFSDNFIELKNSGMLFYQKKMFPLAIDYWEKSLELRPDETLIKKYLARCYHETGETQKAGEIINALLEEQKNNAEELADLTFILFEFGETEKALTNLGRLQQLAPAHPAVQKISGKVAESEGEFKKATELYESAFKNNPEDLETIRSLGDLFFQQELWKKYIMHYEKALEHHPNNPEFLAKLGEALLTCPEKSLQNFEKGREFSERAFTFYDCPPDILVSSGSQLAYAYAMLGNKPKALSTIGKTVNIGRRLNLEPARQQKLENLYRGIQRMQ